MEIVLGKNCGHFIISLANSCIIIFKSFFIFFCRQNYQQLQPYNLPVGLNPRSKLHFLSQTPEGVQFLGSRLQKLEQRRAELDHDSEFYYIRATYLDALGENSAALESVERSLKLSDSDIPKRCKLRSYLNCVRSLPEPERAKLWLFCKLKAEQDMRRLADKTISSNLASTTELTVDRVKYSDLSVQQFLGKLMKKTNANWSAVTVWS